MNAALLPFSILKYCIYFNRNRKEHEKRLIEADLTVIIGAKRDVLAETICKNGIHLYDVTVKLLKYFIPLSFFIFK